MFSGIYYMNDVYRCINNMHIRACYGLHLVTVLDSELLLRSRPIGRTELAWPIIDLTF